MKKQLYSIYDEKSEFYQPPITFLNDEDAKRGLATVFNNPDSMLAKFPNDYKLYHIGTLDDNAGKIEPQIPARLISTVAALNPRPEQPKAPIVPPGEKKNC